MLNEVDFLLLLLGKTLSRRSVISQPLEVAPFQGKEVEFLQPLQGDKNDPCRLFWDSSLIAFLYISASTHPESCHKIILSTAAGTER